LPQPGLGHGEVKEDTVLVGSRVEGVAEGLVGPVGLLVDELAADVVLGGEVSDGLCAGQSSEGQLLALVGIESMGGRSGGGGVGYNAHAWNSLDRVP